MMTLQDQQNIKQKLSKVDELLTKECILCGDFLLDFLGTATISDEPQRPRTLIKKQNSYSIDLATAQERQLSDLP